MKCFEKCLLIRTIIFKFRIMFIFSIIADAFPSLVWSLGKGWVLLDIFRRGGICIHCMQRTHHRVCLQII